MNPAVLEIRYSTNYRYYCSTGNDLRRGSTSLKQHSGIRTGTGPTGYTVKQQLAVYRELGASAQLHSQCARGLQLEITQIRDLECYCVTVTVAVTCTESKTVKVF